MKIYGEVLLNHSHFLMSLKDCKNDFPLLLKPVDGKPLTYLDSASTTQKPAAVIDSLVRFYEEVNANIHRGVHTLSERATELFEGTREKVREFVNAKDSSEIIFTRGATEAINLVTATWGEQNIAGSDEILVTALEHHSNFVPWQQICIEKKAKLVVVPIHEDGTLDMEAYINLLSKRTRLVAVTMMSNAIGAIIPIKKIVQAARSVGAITLIDGAQGVPHLGVDVQDLDCDFLAFSSHKMCGPTGVGVLYGRRDLLESMPPYQLGGDMVKEVFDDHTTWNDLPHKFEAGTPEIANVVAFSAALDYLGEFSFDEILKHDQELVRYAREKLPQLPRLQLYGPQDVTLGGGIVSFNVPGVHPHDVGTILNSEGVAIRTGHHCAQPLMNRLGCSATARMSFYIYNSKEDIDATISALEKVYDIFGVEGHLKGEMQKGKSKVKSAYSKKHSPP